MKIQLIAIGKINDGNIASAIEKYIKRLSHYVNFQTVTIPDVKTTRSMTEQKQKEAEGQSILSSIDSRDCLILLDEKGKEFTSREFASYYERLTMSLPGKLVFAVGGPYGFSKEVYERANDKISLSRMTLTHEMVRLFFIEQFYRAMTIIRGEPYHHD